MDNQFLGIKGAVWRSRGNAVAKGAMPEIAPHSRCTRHPAPAKAPYPLALKTPGCIVPQDGEGDRTVDRCHKQGLQIRVRIGESVGIAGLVDNLRINVAPAVPERLIGRKLRAVIGAVRGEVPLIDADAEISE